MIAEAWTEARRRSKTHSKWQVQEIERCRTDYAYFLNRYAWIESATEGEWIRFEMWRAQAQTLSDFIEHDQIIVLKARQLGLTWLVLGYVLADMLFSPIAIALFFSRGEVEAKDLLTRLKGMYSRLPEWMKAGAPLIDNTQEWRLANGSRAQSFPTTGGRSYTASIVVVDEADFIDNLNNVMNAVKPTIDAGGKMILISTVDKGKPQSTFKQIYRAAKRKLSEWLPVFLPWHSRPGRDAAWYAEQTADILARTTALDDLHQEYPATDTEALAPRSLDKRIPSAWLEKVYTERSGSNPLGLPGCNVYVEPKPKAQYVIGADPAEGNPNSDDSAATVLDKVTGEECAVIAGKFQPEVLGGYVSRLSVYFNNAPAMVERNNHGHTVLLWLKDNSKVLCLRGVDRRPGWLSSSKGKVMLYDSVTEALRNGEVTIHSFETVVQLGSIEGSTLRAPEGQYDDRADAFALAWRGVLSPPPQSNEIPASGGKRSFR